MAKINKTYKPGDEFTPDSVNEIITAVNENTDNISKTETKYFKNSNIQCGVATIALKANSITETLVNFPNTFNQVPIVVITPSSDISKPLTWNLLYFSVLSITNSKFKIVVKNQENNERSVFIQWIAMEK